MKQKHGPSQNKHKKEYNNTSAVHAGTSIQLQGDDEGKWLIWMRHPFMNMGQIMPIIENRLWKSCVHVHTHIHTVCAKICLYKLLRMTVVCFRLIIM